jgi:small nuclear ribonucleoprotein (snRNP)-like protein
VLRRVLTIALITALTCLSAKAQAGTEGQDAARQRKAASVKAKVQKIGTSEKRQVRVKLQNGTELRGYISKIDGESFTVTDGTIGVATALSYDDVQSVEGKGLSTAAKVLIVTGIGAGIAVAVVAIHGVHPVGSGPAGGFDGCIGLRNNLSKRDS